MNCVQMIGRLTKDPVCKYTPDQTAVTTFTLAIDRPPRRDGQKQTDFPKITVFGKQAEIVEKYIHKGDRIAVEGRIQTGSYEKDGQRYYTTDVVAFKIHFLESKKSDDRTAESHAEPAELPPQFDQITTDIPF